MRKLLHFIHCTNAGFVDTIGFVALHGLMAAHVTGNIVTLSGSIALGLHANLAKILALPMFFVVLFVLRLLTVRLHERNEMANLRRLLEISLVLLIAVAGMSLAFGPFPDADHPMSVLTAMLLVSAMAAQNMVQRVHLATMPPTTMMTGTITGLMVDLANLTHDRHRHGRAQVLDRTMVLVRGLIGFVTGGLLGAAAFIFLGRWCFAPPVLLTIAALVTVIAVADEEASAARG